MTYQKKILRFICILAVSMMLVPTGAEAQQYGFHRRQRSAQEQAIEDSIPLWRGVIVGVDVVGPAMRAFGDYGQLEAQVKVNLKDRWFPTVEVGYGTADHEDDQTEIRYKTSTPYGRIGIDFNILKNKHDKYRVLIGARYGYTSFNYDIGPLTIVDPVWKNDATWEAKSQKCTYGWAEAVAGVDATIWKFLHLGWTFRYRARLHQKYDDAGEPWYVPGFGVRGGTRIGAEFNINFEF